MMDIIDEYYILHLMHNDIWPEELLAHDFMFIVENILTRRQRQILELKVDNLNESAIAKTLNVSPSTVRRQLAIIKNKFRNKMTLRVDDMVEGKKYAIKKKKEIQEKKTKTSSEDNS